MRKFSPWFIVIGVVVILAIWLGASYNGFISSKAGVDNAWSKVEAQYQRRVDLIPNLVATVKGASNFEQETFVQVTQARSDWAQAKALGDRGQEVLAAQKFDTAVNAFKLTVEAYPQLKATQAYTDLMTQVEGTENRVTVARTDFNDAVMSYNVRVMRFPGNLAAKIFGFAPETAFQAAAGSENAPVVDFTK